MQTEPVLDASVQIEQFLDATVQTQAVLVQAAVRRRRSVVGTPDDSDAKSTKSMSELLGVESITGGGKTKKKKSSAKKK